nr:MAG TPA: hypothetical protein [Caudoviricetes sp.]
MNYQCAMETRFCFWAFALELDCIVSRFNRFVKPYFVLAFGRYTNNFCKLE